jgi:hypothetical protein
MDVMGIEAGILSRPSISRWFVSGAAVMIGRQWLKATDDTARRLTIWRFSPPGGCHRASQHLVILILVVAP